MAINIAQSTEQINQNFKDNLTCSICQDILRVPVYTVNVCQHVFCETCIREARLHADTCPNCREPIQGLARSTFIENILDIFYQMNTGLPRREPCEPWTEPESRSPSPEPFEAHMAMPFYSFYPWVAMYSGPAARLMALHGRRRSRRLRGLPPVEAPPTLPESTNEPEEQPTPVTLPEASLMNITPEVADEPPLETTSGQEVPEAPTRRGRKRRRVERVAQGQPEQQPESSTSSQPTEDRTCVLRQRLAQ